MGNPAGEKRKLKEKRRKRQALRLGPGGQLPKAEREAPSRRELDAGGKK